MGDSSLTHFYHHVLNMKEPRYEYDFPPPYTTPWNEKMPRIFTPFNFFLDTKREPKEIQEEVLRKKLKLTHPFKGQLDKDIKFPNAHEPFFYYHKDKAKHGSGEFVKLKENDYVKEYTKIWIGLN